LSGKGEEDKSSTGGDVKEMNARVDQIITCNIHSQKNLKSKVARRRSNLILGRRIYQIDIPGALAEYKDRYGSWLRFAR
jgi:hypothetical protein